MNEPSPWEERVQRSRDFADEWQKLQVRKRLLEQDVQAFYVKLARAKGSFRAATLARFAGVSVNSVHQWMCRGRVIRERD